MSIRPVEFNAFVQRTHDVSTVKQNEDNKPAFNQHVIQGNQKKEAEHSLKHVKKGDDANKKDEKYDAKEKGSNQYEDRRGGKRSAKDKLGQDKVVNKVAHGGFDIKV